MKRAPIVIFPYNRIDRLEALLESLLKCRHVNEHEVFFFSDAPNPKYPGDLKKVNDVRNYLEEVQKRNYFLRTNIILSEVHKGPGRAIRDGIDYVFERNDILIDIEDDLLLSEDFLDYIDEGLQFFEKDMKIWSICGFMTPVNEQDDNQATTFLGERSSSWGFGLWKNRWELIDWSMNYYGDFINDSIQINEFAEQGYDMPHMLVGKAEHIIDTWDIDTSYTQYKEGMLSVFPKKSKSFNMGTIGANHSGEEIYQQEIDLSSNSYSFEDIKYDSLIAKMRKSLYMTKEQFLAKPLYSDTEKYRNYYRLMTKWLKDERNGVKYDQWLKEKEVTSIAIYGAGPLGLLFKDIISDYKDITFEFFIDEKIDQQKLDNPVIRIDENHPNIDMIVVTPIMDFYSISKQLSAYYEGTKIISLWEVIFG